MVQNAAQILHKNRAKSLCNLPIAISFRFVYNKDNKRKEIQKMDYIKGSVVWVNFGEAVGSEQGKTRPAVIVSCDSNNRNSSTITVVPFTSKIKKGFLPCHFVLGNVNGLVGDNMALAEQIRTVDKLRINNYAGHLTKEQVKGVDKAVLAHLGL